MPESSTSYQQQQQQQQQQQVGEWAGKGARGAEAASVRPAKGLDTLQLVEDSAHNLLIGASSQEEVLQRGFSPAPAATGCARMAMSLGINSIVSSACPCRLCMCDWGLVACGCCLHLLSLALVMEALCHYLACLESLVQVKNTPDWDMRSASSSMCKVCCMYLPHAMAAQSPAPSLPPCIEEQVHG